MTRKILNACALCGCLVAAGASAAVKDGVYTSSVPAHNAPITVQVTFGDNKITAIKVIKDLESRGIGKLAIDKLTHHMLQTQSVAVDGITGATFTSFALKKAVSDCILQAGGDENDFSKEVDLYPHYDETIDTQVVIVGGGGAGLAAAISAQQHGANVVILEKMGYLGGSTNVNGGGFNAVDPKRQIPQGIEDSIEKFYKQTLEGGHNTGDPKLVRYMIDNAYPTIEWLESLGVQFKDALTTGTGALWQRTHVGTTPTGNHYIKALEKYVAEHADQISVFFDTDVKQLVRDKSGRITGVMANNHGRTLRVNASKGVILATGGFAANIPMRQKYNTGIWKEVKLDAHIGASPIAKAAQGDGIVMGQKVGAALTNMSDIQLHPNGDPKTGLMIGLSTRGRNCLFINEEGNRFVNEGAARDVLSKAIFQQPHQTYWLMVNKVRYPARDWMDAEGYTANDLLEQKLIVTADTLEELAAKMNVDPQNLKRAVDEYNEVVTGKVQKDRHGFVSNNTADKPMTEGPWYAQKKVPTIHHTMGGLKISTNNEVLGKNGQPIKGLYAVGEVTGGIHGSNRLGGNANTDIFTFGRHVGEVVANQK